MQTTNKKEGDKKAQSTSVEYYLANDIETIRNYCESDALNTYLVYLRYQLIRGKLNDNLYLDECEKVKEMLLNESKMHLKKFLKVWQKDK